MKPKYFSQYHREKTYELCNIPNLLNPGLQKIDVEKFCDLDNEIVFDYSIFIDYNIVSDLSNLNNVISDPNLIWYLFRLDGINHYDKWFDQKKGIVVYGLDDVFTKRKNYLTLYRGYRDEELVYSLSDQMYYGIRNTRKRNICEYLSCKEYFTDIITDKNCCFISGEIENTGLIYDLYGSN